MDNKAKWVDFSKTGMDPEMVSRIIQEVAFSVGIGWRELGADLRSGSINIGYSWFDGGLTSGWSIKYGKSVSLTDFLSWIVTQGKKFVPVEPEKTWLDDLIGKRVLRWNTEEPGKIGWSVEIVKVFKIEDKVYCINGYDWKHFALIDGYEYRLFLDHSRWINHDCEV